MIQFSELRSIIKDQFGQGVIWNFASLGILAVGGIVINSVILGFIDESALGMFNQVNAIYIVLSQLSVAGLQFSVLKHISHKQNDLDHCADVLGSALILGGLFSTLVAILGWLVAPLVANILQSPDVSLGIRYVMLGLVFFSLNKILINSLNGLGLMKAYAFFRSVRYILIPVGIVISIYLRLPTPTILLPITVTETIIFLILFSYIYIRLLPVKRIANFLGHIQQHLSFGLRSFLSGILIVLNTRIDVLMLGYFSTDAIVGIYSFAAMFIEGFGQLALAVRWNVDPVLGEFFATGRQGEIKSYVSRIRRAFLPFIWIIVIGSIVFYPIAALVFPAPIVFSSWGLFVIMIIGVGINAGYRPFLGLLPQSGFPGAFTALNLVLVFSDALLNFILIPVLGIYGAAIVTLVTFVLEALALRYFAQRLLSIKL